MRGFIAPGNAVRRNHGINHGLFCQQPKGVGQRDAVAEHGADDSLTLHHRIMKLRADKPLPLQLLAQRGKQRLPIHRSINYLKVGLIKILIQHPRTRAVHQHQLADLVELIVGRKRRNGHHRFIFLADAHGGDDKIFRDFLPLFIFALREGGGNFQLRILPLQDGFNHPHHRVAGIAHQQHLRLTLVADIVMALQPDADMQHQKADLIFADGVGGIFSPAGYRRQGHIPRHRIVLLDVIEQRIGDHYLVAHAGDHGLNMGL